MGANLQIIGFSDKIKTAQQALKNANERGEQSRYEDGHMYSGAIGMLCWRVIPTVFDSVDDFEKFLENKDKDDGVIAQVKVIRETKPLVKAKQDWYVAASAFRNVGWDRRSGKRITPAQERRLEAKAVKAEAKYRKLLKAQADKSTKTRFIGGGWCAE